MLLSCGGVLLLLVLASIHFHDVLLRNAAENGLEQIAANRVRAVAEALARTPRGERQAISQALSGPDLEVRLLPADARHGLLLGEAAQRGKQGDQEVEIQIARTGEGSTASATARLRLPDADAIEVLVRAPSLLAVPDRAFDLYVGAIAMALLLIAALAVRAVVRPFAVVAGSLDQMAPGQDLRLTLSKDAPREVRHVVAALEAMGARVRDVLQQRSLALAALSHDLMSPISRMLLRLEHDLDDAGVARLRSDLGEMETMVEDVLAYLRGGHEGEPSEDVSILALIQVVVDEFAERGAIIEEGPLEDSRVHGRPIALKRAIRNLLANALRYGDGARVDLIAQDKAAVVLISDRGPGMPPDELARAFDPFFRGDRSRTQGDGSGLGLPTALAIVRSHGGTLELTNLPSGGLLATMCLPCRPGFDLQRESARRRRGPGDRNLSDASLTAVLARANAVRSAPS